MIFFFVPFSCCIYIFFLDINFVIVPTDNEAVDVVSYLSGVLCFKGISGK